MEGTDKCVIHRAVYEGISSTIASQIQQGQTALQSDQLNELEAILHTLLQAAHEMHLAIHDELGAAHTQFETAADIKVEVEQMRAELAEKEALLSDHTQDVMRWLSACEGVSAFAAQ
mmetsp:Transcript_8336/g.18160  ORF Transcript_8336/g.18160 Transcript_8336/m.18160 type:complete len:117 (-) Transcript_8336:717-1067(-)|eukprot:6165130-Pleurochrysis_carterae.AAC.3